MATPLDSLRLDRSLPEAMKQTGKSPLTPLERELVAALKNLLAVCDAQRWGAAWPGRPHAQADAAERAISRAETEGR